MKETIAKELSKHSGLPQLEISKAIEVPPSSDLGDFAFPCFMLAKTLKKNPVEIAKDLSSTLKIPGLEKIEAKGPYVNFFLDKNFLITETIGAILKNKDNYGKILPNDRKLMIEFPSPNTNKPLHLGHLKNMALGESVSRILEARGNTVIRANLNNDRGIHICKSMLAYKKWGNGKDPKKQNIKSDHLIGEFYVLFSKLAKEDPSLEIEAQEMLKKWESGDKETIALWKKMNKWAFDGFKETYKLFNIKHDKEYFESKIYKEGKEIILEGLKKGIFKKNADGSIIADLKDEALGEKVMLRADGTSIYITQDVYLAILKDKEFNLDGSIYVVANEQEYHFKVLFSILKRFGYEFTKDLHHLSYGMVELPEGRMKSREGTVVDADDLILETKELAKKEIKERYPDLKENEVDKRSLKIALCAIKYILLKISNKKNIVFNPKEAISFEGDTGPYLLYSYARAKSILRKGKYKPSTKLKFSKISDKEKELASNLAKFPDIILQAEKNLSPNIIANYAFEIAQNFNAFYHSEQVIGSDNQELRLALVDCFSIVLKNALQLLGIDTIEKM